MMRGIHAQLSQIPKPKQLTQNSYKSVLTVYIVTYWYAISQLREQLRTHASQLITVYTRIDLFISLVKNWSIIITAMHTAPSYYIYYLA